MVYSFVFLYPINHNEIEMIVNKATEYTFQLLIKVYGIPNSTNGYRVGCVRDFYSC